MDLSGKKLLILGGNLETVSLVEVANKMGIKTIVTSARESDPAKKVAWKSFNIDGLDVSGIVSLVRNELIDGVLVGVADILVPAYSKVCEILNLPCYANQKIVDIFSYKDTFKETCEEYGIRGIPQFKLDENFHKDDLRNVIYPVMVKPVDNGGGVGMSVCYTEKDLIPAVEKALTASNEKRFLVEKYMTCDDMGIYYTFKDGDCSASCVYDRYTTTEQPGLSRVCLGGTYPSKFIDVYFRKMHPKATKMFKEIGINNGVLMLSAFYENEEFYVYDTGFRLQGEAPHIFIKEIQGFDQREMLIKFALTGSAGDFNLLDADDPYLRGKWASTLWFLVKEGEISKIIGLDEVYEDKRIIANVQRLYEGDAVTKEWIGTEKQVLTRLYLVCETKQELYLALNEYMNKVKVYNSRGDNLLLTGFDTKVALEL